MTQKTETPTENIKLVIYKESWSASAWSDFQTFGFMCAAFAVNVHLIGNNGWLNFCLTLAMIAWALGKAATKSRKIKGLTTLNTTDRDEAIAFLNENADGVRKNV